MVRPRIGLLPLSKTRYPNPVTHTLNLHLVSATGTENQYLRSVLIGIHVRIGGLLPDLAILQLEDGLALPAREFSVASRFNKPLSANIRETPTFPEISVEGGGDDDGTDRQNGRSTASERGGNAGSA